MISAQMEVTAFVRTKATLADAARQVTVVEGDVFDRRAVAGVSSCRESLRESLGGQKKGGCA